MNKQIIELYKQAQEFAYKNISEEYWNTATFSAVVSGKFAELIVKECMEQINKVEEKGNAHLGGGYFYDGTRLCRDAIKQHFGVEE